MRKIIAALQTSVDGFIEGPNGELDWSMAEDEETWRDVVRDARFCGTCILGRVTYPVYEQYWMAVLANPAGPLPLSGQPATQNEIKYARWADKTPHIVVSKTLDKVAWKTSRIVRHIEEIRNLRQQPGKNMHVVGGATMVGSLMNAGLIDEVQLLVNPLILGGGKVAVQRCEGSPCLEALAHPTAEVRQGKPHLQHVT
jgi:dihydrofolate reductase